MLLSKVACVTALGVATFPCWCEGHPPLVPHVHGIAAGVMFLILAFFCYLFFERAREKGYAQAKLRSVIYVLCGLAILSSILVIGGDWMFGGELSLKAPRLTFYGEATGLVAFGVSWLTASRVLPILTASEERFSPLRDQNPD